MIGTDGIQYVKSDKFRGIVVTHRDYEKLREANPNPEVILEEANIIKMNNAELRRLDPEYIVIVSKKMKHLDSIRTHISNITLITSFDVSNKVIPQFVLRAFNSIQNHSDDFSFYIMKLYEPNYKITEYAVEEKTLASCGEREINVAAIMKEMEFSDDLARNADKIYKDGLGFSNILGFFIHAYSSYKSSSRKMNVDADLHAI